MAKCRVGGQCKKHESVCIYHHQKVKILRKKNEMSERTEIIILIVRWLIIYGSLRYKQITIVHFFLH